ncbi:MAG: hypothetical protein IJ064_05500 [Bacteroidaceae bacterium]|nr:hypothetical protein [Bacteroidaceae bacterium]
MSVLDFAPHTLDYLEVVPGHDDEETGDYIKGSEIWVEGYCKCDAVPAGKANTITTPDGQVEPYSYTIYNLPRTCRKFVYGERVRIRFFGHPEEVSEFTVKGFHRYQKQCKMWV